MFMNKKVVMIVIGGALVLALGIGAAAVASITVAKAGQSVVLDKVELPMFEARFGLGGSDGFAHRGGGFPDGRLFPGVIGANDTYLAEALGISVEELQAAYDAAWQNALDQAVADGWLTEKQAQAMQESGMGPHPRGFIPGGWLGLDDPIDFESLLAEELGISVGELQDALQQASEAALQAAVENGEITQEMADRVQARQALKGYVDHDVLLAKVLGLSADELQAARQEGKSMSALIEEAGLTAEEFRQAMQEAYEAAVQQAVEDGAITQEQADIVLSDKLGVGRGPIPGFGGERPFERRGRGGFECFPIPPESTETPEGDGL